MFDDAVHAWRTGEFEGIGVFQAEDPGGEVKAVASPDEPSGDDTLAVKEMELERGDDRSPDPNAAGIRVDLSVIGATRISPDGMASPNER